MKELKNGKIVFSVYLTLFHFLSQSDDQLSIHILSIFTHLSFPASRTHHYPDPLCNSVFPLCNFA